MNLPKHTLSVLISVLPGISPAAEKQTPEEVGLQSEIRDFKELLNFPNHPYSEALGFTLWKSPGSSLKEVSSLPFFDTVEAREELKRQIDRLYPEKTAAEKEALFAKLSEKRLIPIYHKSDGKPQFVSPEDYAKFRLNPRLGIFDESGEENGSAILFSIRDSFSFFNANQEGFALDYTNTDGDGTLRLKGALTSDIYLDSLYNSRWIHDPWIIQNTYRLSLRTGVEFDTNEAAKTPTDRTSFYLLGNFQANPDQNAHLFGVDDFWQVTSPQFVQIGAAYDHDDFSGESDIRWILGWQPRLYVIKDWDFIARSFGINHKMRYLKNDVKGFASFQKPDPTPGATKIRGEDDEQNLSPWYTYIPADIKLTGGSDVINAVAKRQKGDFSKVNLEWKLGFAVGHSDSKFRFGYLAEGVSPAADLGDTHIGQSVFCEIGLGSISSIFADSQRNDPGNLDANDLPEHDVAAATLFAKFKFGEHAPSFEKHEEFQIGTRIRF